MTDELRPLRAIDVAQTILPGGIIVSTLAVQGVGANNQPETRWETCVFGADLRAMFGQDVPDSIVDGYRDRAAAIRGHAAAVTYVVHFANQQEG